MSERQPSARQTYLDADARLIRAFLPPGLATLDATHPLFLLYAVLLRAKGEAVTLSDVHDAWAA